MLNTVPEEELAKPPEPLAFSKLSITVVITKSDQIRILFLNQKGIE